MTVTEIYELLGFKPPWEFAVEQMRMNLGEKRVFQLGYEQAAQAFQIFRQTGRSTRIVVAAIATVLTGEITSISYADDMENTRQLLRIYIERLGLTDKIEIKPGASGIVLAIVLAPKTGRSK